MRKLIWLFVTLALCAPAIRSQTTIRNARQKSYQALVYRIPADSAEKYIRTNLVFPDHLAGEMPFAVWSADTLRHEDLPPGNYLIATVVGTDLQLAYYCQSNINVFPLNNQHRVQLEVRDVDGKILSNARLWSDGKEIPYNPAISGFQMKDKRPDEAIIRIAIPGDTLFVELSSEMYEDRSAWQQWWSNLPLTRTGSILTWPVQKIKSAFGQQRYYRSGKRNKRRSTNKGYIVFNKPRYLPDDTVKLKAYILDRKGHRIRKALDLSLSVLNRSYDTIKVERVSPISPGSFLYEFVIGDSLDSDKTYVTAFFDRKGNRVMTGQFMIEDYLLDAIAKYNLRSEKEKYFRNDTIVCYANARDANDLPLMDGRVRLYILSGRTDRIFTDRAFVPDTIWREEKTLTIDGDTRFAIPTTAFPNADLELKALAVFLNSNNETQDKSVSFSFISDSRVLQIKDDAGYLFAEYLVGGKSIDTIGWVEAGEQQPRRVMLPYRERINPFNDQYLFWLEDSLGKRTIYTHFNPRNYNVLMSRFTGRDSTGFILHNPNRVLVHYSVFDGGRMVAAGADSAEQIAWKGDLPGRRIFKVEWSYIWAGEEKFGFGTIARLDKLLSAEISASGVVYPGQTDTLSVTVKDYRGRPAKGVNLAAVSYNSQFGQNAQVKEPPYLGKFRQRNRIVFDRYELDWPSFSVSYKLGQHQVWRRAFAIDSMLYYQLLFPRDSYSVSTQLISDFLPQLAVHVVKNGVPQQIYLLYVNRRFEWYHGTTVSMPYAIQVMPGYAQIGIRLRDSYVEVDSIYMQPNYKHDVFIDLDKLPRSSRVESRSDHYSRAERARIERQVLQLENHPANNNAYIWQGDRVAHTRPNQARHLVGPYTEIDSVQFFKPGYFDIKFAFESGYRYRLSPGMARLEKSSILPANRDSIELPALGQVKWALGDTIVPPPTISYIRPPAPRELNLVAEDRNMVDWNDMHVGRLRIFLPQDSVFIYGILQSHSPGVPARIRSVGLEGFLSVAPGKYQLILITKHLHYLVAKDVEIQPHGTTLVRFTNPRYESSNHFVAELEKNGNPELVPVNTQPSAPTITSKEYPQAPTGKARITGVVKDRKGMAPIAGAVISIRGYANATVSDSKGHFRLENIGPGRYSLMVSYVGYAPLSRSLSLTEGATAELNFELSLSELAMEEVVVVGYGVQKKQSLTYALSSVNAMEVTGALSGRIAGVNVAENSPIRIRGASSVNVNSKPLYVINGVPLDELPLDFDPKNATMNILRGEAATSLYGSRAADGVIIFTTSDFLPKALRSEFRDYAFWQPQLITNSRGEASFVVTYPDNITGWQTYVVGMDKKKRITKSSTFTSSFKPMLAQLATPQFLVEGDSSAFVGKLINYTDDEVSLSTAFKLGDGLVAGDNQGLAARAATNEKFWVNATQVDTIVAEYGITTSSGYRDAEQRKIPVVRSGTVERVGGFWILDRDTSFVFTPDPSAGEISIHAQANTLDVLLDEIERLKEYPYYCMEQTASKLLGLAAEKKIRKALGHPYSNEAMERELLGKLQKSQLFEGGWSWWPNGDASLPITNYVTMALLSYREDPVTAQNIRNALLFLHHKLSTLEKGELVEVLLTMAEAGHEMNYAEQLKRVNFDSLSTHHQWQIVRIRQLNKLPIEKEMTMLMNKRNETMLGGLYWGEESYYWRSNAMATTVLAFKVLDTERNHQQALNHVLRYFLSQRRAGKWNNTVESASILSTVLPYVLRIQPGFDKPAALIIGTNKEETVSRFPFSMKMTASEPVNIRKSGGGLVYISTWQTKFNPRPTAVSNQFTVNTWFERNGRKVESLTSGEKVIMKVSIVVNADAEFIQLEVPIPAGCTYGAKRQEYSNSHREYLKDRTILFIEQLKSGTHEFSIELEPRYSGYYTVNPARIELMYFPVFYGRNGIGRIDVDK